MWKCGNVEQPVLKSKNISFFKIPHFIYSKFAYVANFLYLCSQMWSLLAIFFLQFANKAGSDSIALSHTAIEMRQERGIDIDSLDYAVSPIYLDSIRALGAEILHTSRWMNGATVKANNEVISTIEKCTFVDTVYVTRREVNELTSERINELTSEGINEPQLSTFNFQLSTFNSQLSQLNLLPLHQEGFKGQGIRIGVADGGFYNANTLASLPREQWLGYADMTDDPQDFFSPEGNHGTLCLSAIVGKKDNYEGAATDAEYFLFRTEEHHTESPKEIDNWVAAIEMADSLGLHIVSTSLGYSTFDDGWGDFSYTDMDGRTSRGAQASLIAARKGMLLVTAMGNEGTTAWHYLSTPADADSILSVGAVNAQGEIAAFSSYGPSADGRVKPEVCAMGAGTALINPANNEVIHGNGTSFACPLIAGMAACLWSALPQATNMEIREMIIRSCNQYEQPHTQYGYGIPDAWLAYTHSTLNSQLSTFNFQLSTLNTKILHNGQIYILHNGQVYDILGNKID